MMNVSDLIRLLERYPEDMRVVVNGYEQGYDDVSPEAICRTRIALNTGVHEWEGRHGDQDDLSAAARGSATMVDALVLRRSSN